MYERFSALCCKEVINVTDGNRLGYVGDLELELECGRVVALIVPKPGKFFGLFGSHEIFVTLGLHPPHRRGLDFGGRQAGGGLPSPGEAEAVLLTPGAGMGNREYGLNAASGGFYAQIWPFPIVGAAISRPLTLRRQSAFAEQICLRWGTFFEKNTKKPRSSPCVSERHRL